MYFCIAYIVVVYMVKGESNSSDLKGFLLNEHCKRVLENRKTSLSSDLKLAMILIEVRENPN